MNKKNDILTLGDGDPMLPTIPHVVVCEPHDYINSCNNEVYESHSCPYAVEIDRNDDEHYCNCCAVCEQKCSDNI